MCILAVRVQNPYKYSGATLSAISILIVFLVLSSCSSHPPAHIKDRSSQYSSSGKTHRVAKGETLFSIAWRYGLDVKKLSEINGIKPPYTIYSGQQLRLDTRSVGSRSSKPEAAKAGAGGTSYTRSKKGTRLYGSVPDGEKLQSSPKWQWPSSGKLLAQFQGETGYNKGIDISGKLGEPVLAAASGRVVYSGSGLSGYGKLLIIKHNETFLSAYAHNEEIFVKEGDLVKAGQKVADMGSSGTDRVKLHFEIRSDGSPVDPLRYLPKRQ